MKNVGDELAQQLKKHNWTKNYQQLIRQAFADQEVARFIKENQTELSKEDLVRSASKVYEFVTIKKKLANGEEVPVPGYRPQLILNNHLIEVAYVPSEQLLLARKQQAVRARVRSLNMPKSVKAAQLSDYDLEGREEVAAAAGNFIEQYIAQPQTFIPGMYLEGSFGVGKTFLLGAIANGLAEEGYQSTLLHFPSFAVELKNAISGGGTLAMIESVKKAPILMLDDLGADQLSSWLRDDVLGVILQYRMQEELSTFFSSNLSMKELQEQYLTINNRGEAEPLKARRIMERIRFLAREYTVIGRNRRHS
ncbi:primosomal protein DnaI [Liquorilactobacillus satsumensis]|uniref:Primosomal protein DnaI n=1 Tax=Liquorilactobacillus satsumensis DSM 16230 = JCM 12392 TaxID=1423801 RepID=A0A0R1V2M1_9LACO|nr:primosomal protein DnaI [Liquorilactobacillus satsumensis]KRL99836.1 primosomal protein DnaI [Liquorilactobacillus satsumensis DSM 16230 = JCM 12392]MCC7665674.1 primosomal protein DnaI [Liquorilactobacillus satsumensis]MCP9311886.1 primosomal protein DnaI [Liquorilactobacillus satsumensis]MCP9328314.1 primosomal protein DnaI [Liquorilactobacillus satsumensis]MCP9356533.1 primosomal protein DnaI [Liquorilactobacillus satsumensis]